MNKRRVFLAILLTLVLLFTVAIASACQDPDTPPETGDENGSQENNGQTTETGSWALQKIALSGSYKTEYQLNEQYSSTGLTVTATMMNTATKETRSDDVTAQAIVNSSKYKAAVVGSYVITVSYTNTDVTRYASYTVKVLPYEPEINGIYMTKQTVEYNIPDGQLAVNVNVDDIVVKAVDDKGAVSETALSADEYTLTYYVGATKLDNLEHATRGAYTIQAERKSDGQKAFVIVNVLGGINGITASTTREKIELANAEATAVINKQDIVVKTDGGKDVVVDETNGPCTKIDYKLYSVAEDKTETPLDNWTVGVGTYKVKITATYVIAANKTIDFTAEVTITVKVKSGDDTKQPVTYLLKSNDLTSETLTAEKTWLAEDDNGNSVSLTASSGKTVVIEANAKSIDGINFTNRIKLGGTGSTTERSIKITVTDTTTITIYAMSSNGSDAREVWLLDASGNVIDLVGKATLDGTTFTSDTKVGGDALHKVAITVEAGTYYFCSKASGLNVYGVNLEIGQD